MNTISVKTGPGSGPGICKLCGDHTKVRKTIKCESPYTPQFKPSQGPIGSWEVCTTHTSKELVNKLLSKAVNDSGYSKYCFKFL